MTKLYRTVLLFVLSALMVPAIVAAKDSSGKVEWYEHEAGIRTAKETGKKVYIFFSTDNCVWCRRMVATTFQDDSVAGHLNQNFIPVHVDREKEPRIAAQYYPGQEVPYSWFLTENGDEIGRLLGYIPPDKMLLYLQFVSTDSYKEMTFEHFSRRSD